MINSDVTEFPLALWQQEEKDAMIFAELEKDQPGAVTKTVETTFGLSPLYVRSTLLFLR